MPKQLDLHGTERLLNKPQLAEKLGVTTRTVDRWLREGTLPADVKVLIGRTARFRAAVADAWITAGCPGASDG